MIKWGKNDSKPWKVIILINFIILSPFKQLFMLLGSLRYLRISGWIKMRVEWGRNDGFLWGKAADFCPTPPLVPTSFGGHSKSSFLSGMTQNDLWTRNAIRMTGMRNGNEEKAFLSCKTNLNYKVQNKCEDSKVKDPGILLYCRDRAYVTCCFRNFQIL